MARSIMVALSGVVVVVCVAARQPSAQVPPTPSDSPYVGADSCKDCHSDFYSAWAKTKHSMALSKLPAADRASGQCIRCHVTGSPEMIAAEGAKPSLPNVQCEACHGPGRAHVQAARAGDAGDARTQKTDEDTCLRCHNETSPRFKPFFYRAMVGLVHQRD